MMHIMLLCMPTFANTAAMYKGLSMLYLEGAPIATKVDLQRSMKYFIQPSFQQERAVCLLVRPIQLLHPSLEALKVL